MLRRFVLLIVLAASASAAAERAVFEIKTLAAQMRYNITDLRAEPGQEVTVKFENGDDLPHNIAFCDPGTDVVAMTNQQLEKAAESLKRNWLPDDKRIWAHSRMLNPHEREEFKFTAPRKPGHYPFVCTFPGHAMVMRGALHVEPRGGLVRDLRFKLYLGDWQGLPDFARLAPHREGPAPDNLVQIKLDDYKNHFGLVFTGKLDVPKAGSHRFLLASDDGSRLLIDGQVLIDNDGIHPGGSIREKGIKLEAGEHDFRLEYFQAAGEQEIFVAWKGAQFAMTPLSKWTPPGWQDAVQKKKDFDPIPLVVKDEPVVYRNFIQGAGNRGIAVGYPGGINLAWSAESMNLALIWRGAFIDASKHWNSRGGGHQPPMGYDVQRPTGEVTPALFVADQPDAPWPKWDKSKRFEGFEWKGYLLDKRRHPVFRYTWRGTSIEDTFTASGDGNKPGGNAKLIRMVRITGEPPDHAWFRIAERAKSGAGEGEFLGPEGFRVFAKEALLAGGNVVIPAKPGTITITYQWAN